MRPTTTIRAVPPVEKQPLRGRRPAARASNAERRFRALPLGAKLALLVAVFVAFVACLLAFSWLQTAILSGVRAYVGGEALWSKGQKDAVHQLVRYAETGDEVEYARYLAAIAVPLGDRQAREMLERPVPDLAVVRDGFVQARNHPEDVPSMVWLFRHFRHVGYMAKAIAIWSAGDRYIAQLQAVGDELHATIAAGVPDPARVATLLARLDAIDRRLTPVEAAFSRTLGKGARRTTRLMRDATATAAVLLVAAGLWLSWRLFRHTREWETRYRHLLDTAGDGILVTGVADGVILEANVRIGEMLGVPRARLIGLRETDVYAEAPRPTRVADGERPRTRELHLRRADGRLLPVEVSAAVTQLARGQVVQSIVRDATERRRAEDERAELLAREQAARAEAERVSRVKDEFLSVLSHELRTPLTPIFAWARLLQRTAHPPADAPRGLQVIERSARSLSRLIDELLDVSRIIAGKLRLDVRPVVLADVVQAALESVRVAAEAKRIRVDAAVAPGAGTVLGDPDRLQQIVWNLASNAIKFTPAGGRVTIAAARHESVVTITVRDTGQGIPASFLPYVFERFQQADSSSVREHGGLGLGLAIVRHLTELHGGTVSVASPGEGQGATFTVTLPARTPVTPDLVPAETAGGEESGGTPASLAGVRVLVVDDEPDTRELVTAVLRGSGAEVVAVESASAALETVDRWPPDVVISDVGMPGEDGHAFMRALRARGGTAAAIPAVALTAYARAEDRKAAESAGFTAHVAKPFDPGMLVAVVARLVRPA